MRQTNSDMCVVSNQLNRTLSYMCHNACENSSLYLHNRDSLWTAHTSSAQMWLKGKTPLVGCLIPTILTVSLVTFIWRYHCRICVLDSFALCLATKQPVMYVKLGRCMLTQKIIEWNTRVYFIPSPLIDNIKFPRSRFCKLILICVPNSGR